MTTRVNEAVRFCPHCRHMVELERQVSGGVEVFKCKNCWSMHLGLDDLPLQPQRRTDDAASTTYGRDRR